MLATGTYPPDYVAAARARSDAALDRFAALAGPGDDFEHAYFADQVLVLELTFVHRLRKHEGKDGNPLNEVRVLASSLVEDGGRLTVPASVKLKPDTSVLGLAEGDEVRVDADGYRRLADAFFAELERRYADA